MTYNSTSSSQYTMPLNMGGYVNTTRSSYVAHPSDRVNPSNYLPVYYPLEVTPVDMIHPRRGNSNRDAPKPVIQRYKQQSIPHCICEDIELVPKPVGNSDDEIREHIGAILNIGLAATFVRENETRIQITEGIEHMNSLFYNCRETRKTLIEKETQIKELMNKLDAYQKNKPDEALFKKRRRDVIYNLNTKGRSPRDDTLKKYNIIFNNNINKYE